MSRIARVATLAGGRGAKEKGIKERREGGDGDGLLAVMKQGRPRRVGRKRTDLAGGQLNESRMSTRCVSCNSHPIVHSLTATGLLKETRQRDRHRKRIVRTETESEDLEM